jgi:hypothetical protein
MNKVINIILKIEKWVSDQVHDMYPGLTKHMKKK